MKRLKLLIMTLLLLETASAQQKTIVHNEQDNTVTITRTLPQFVNKHDIRVGLGSFSLVQSLFLDEFGWHPVEDYTYDFRYEMEKTDSYSSPRYFTASVGRFDPFWLYFWSQPLRFCRDWLWLWWLGSYRYWLSF